MTTAALSYAIDEHDHLIRVDEGYYRFAEENGWADAGSSLGRLLWDYVAGPELVKLQRMLIRRVREDSLCHPDWHVFEVRDPAWLVGYGLRDRDSLMNYPAVYRVAG